MNRKGNAGEKKSCGTLQPHPSSTQSETSMSKRLEGVRKAARENKETKFTALLHHMTVDLLRESFYALKRKAAPRGGRTVLQGHSPRGECLFRKMMGGNVHLGSRPWKIRSSGKPRLPSSIR